MSDVLILVESKGGALEKMTLELIRGAKRPGQGTGYWSFSRGGRS